MELLIREAVTADYGNLCALFEEGDLRHREHYPRIFQKPEGPVRTSAFVDDLLADEAQDLFLAEVDGRLVGLLHVAIKTPPAFPILVQRRYAMIKNIVVAAGCRRRGVGRTLMEQAKAWATMKGAESIELNVWGFNDGALEFYRSLGYETLNREMGLWLSPEGNAD